jgi:hypothetical protein
MESGRMLDIERTQLDEHVPLKSSPRRTRPAEAPRVSLARAFGPSSPFPCLRPLSAPLASRRNGPAPPVTEMVRAPGQNPSSVPVVVPAKSFSVRFGPRQKGYLNRNRRSTQSRRRDGGEVDRPKGGGTGRSSRLRWHRRRASPFRSRRCRPAHRRGRGGTRRGLPTAPAPVDRSLRRDGSSEDLGARTPVHLGSQRLLTGRFQFPQLVRFSLRTVRGVNDQETTKPGSLTGRRTAGRNIQGPKPIVERQLLRAGPV